MLATFSVLRYIHPDQSIEVAFVLIADIIAKAGSCSQ
jgi:hypothetical protein